MANKIEDIINNDIQKGSDIINEEAKQIDDALNTIKNPNTTIGTKISVILGVLLTISTFYIVVKEFTHDITKQAKPLIKVVASSFKSTSQPGESK